MDFDPSTATLDKPEFDPTSAKPDAPVKRSGFSAVPTEADEGRPAVQPPPAAPAPAAQTSPNGTPLKLPAQPALGGITAAIQAGMHMVDSIAGSLVGGLSAIPLSAASVAQQGINKLRGQPVDPNAMITPVQAQERATEQVSSGLANMPGRVTDRPETEALTDKANDFMQGAPAVAALHGTMGPAGGVEAGVKGVQRMGAGSAVRNITPFVRDSAKVAADDATAAKLAAPENQGISDAIGAGYKITPKAGGGGAIAKSAQTAAGSSRLEGSLSAHNAENTARLAREDIGVAPDEPLTHELTQRVRTEAGQDYAAVQNAGQITLDGQLQADLGRIAEPYVEGGKDFSQLAKNPIIDAINTLREDSGKPVEAASVISIVKDLRNKSDKEFGPNGDKKLGNDYRAAASALDNAMDRSLTKQAEVSGDPALADAVTKYQAARVRIAKTYMLDDAMRGATKPGEINAIAYRQALDRGVKLDGPGLSIANFAKQFGGEGLAKSKSKGGHEGPSYHDIVLGVLHGGPLGAAAVFARPGARALLASDRMQQRMAQSARDRLPPEEAAPPAAAAPSDPTTSPGAGPGAPAAAAPAPGPLGDLTPEWSTSPGVNGPARPGAEPGLVQAVDEIPPNTTPGAAPPAAPGSQIPVHQEQPLGDHTPMWSTSQGAGGGAARGGHEPGLVGDEPTHTPFVRSGKRAGEQIPAVPGRPDLPDSMTTGLPAEVSPNSATNAAMDSPGAQQAMRNAKAAREAAARAEIPTGEATELSPDQVAALETPKRGEIPTGQVTEGQPEIAGSTPPKSIPAGKATEGQPEIKGAGAPAKIPVGKATEITPEVIELGRKWQREQGLGDDDAARAHAVARAFDHDPEATAAAAEKFDNNPAAFDAEIVRLNTERTAREDATHEAARRGKGDAGGAGAPAGAAGDAKAPVPQGAQGGPDATAAAVRTAGDDNGADGAGAAGAERGDVEPAGGQAETGWRVVADQFTKRVRDANGSMHTVVKLPDGSIRRITRLNRTESMGLPGWHDMDSDGHSFLADTEADAIKALIAKGKK